VKTWLCLLLAARHSTMRCCCLAWREQVIVVWALGICCPPAHGLLWCCCCCDDVMWLVPGVPSTQQRKLCMLFHCQLCLLFVLRVKWWQLDGLNSQQNSSAGLQTARAPGKLPGCCDSTDKRFDVAMT
jgi:hypothetical protein